MKKSLWIIGAILIVAGVCWKVSTKPKSVEPIQTETTESMAMDMNVATSTDTGAKQVKDEGATVTLNVTGQNFSFTPNQITVKKGAKVKVVFTATQGTHNFVIDEFQATTKTVSNGGTDTVEFVADKAGTFEYYCSIGKHRALGMVGTLTVE